MLLLFFSLSKTTVIPQTSGSWACVGGDLSLLTLELISGPIGGAPTAGQVHSGCQLALCALGLLGLCMVPGSMGVMTGSTQCTWAGPGDLGQVGSTDSPLPLPPQPPFLSPLPLSHPRRRGVLEQVSILIISLFLCIFSKFWLLGRFFSSDKVGQKTKKT